MENVNRLVELLENQKMIYKGLLDISKKKTDVLVKANVKELENITKIEQTLVLNMAKLEENFEKVMSDLKKELSISENEINISTIIKYISKDDSQKIDKLRNEIFDIINGINRANEHNSQLIKNSLDYISFSVNLFSNSKSSAGGGYGHSGDVQMDTRSIFDKKL